jgi:magnesium-transporting ATPase (P-type)
MSVVVQDRDGQIWLYCKGAESSVIPLTEAGPINDTLKHVADFALVRLMWKIRVSTMWNKLKHNVSHSENTQKHNGCRQLESSEQNTIQYI